MTTLNYYSDTAYDSDKQQINHASNSGSSQDNFLANSVADYLVKGQGQQCREFIATQDMDDIEILVDDAAPEKKYSIHEEITWYSLKNPRELLRLITHFCMFISVTSIPGIFILGLITSFDKILISTSVYFIIFPLIIFFTGQYAIKKNWIKDKNNTLLNRRTGLVTFTWKRKRVSHPFHEFTAAIRHNVGRSGTRYHLFLYHSQTGHFCMEPGGQTDEWKTEIEWEILQQYLDISQPLPDIPRMECFRARDPITHAWDKENNRPTNYWRDIPLDQAHNMHDKSVLAAQQFHWGATRESAITSGWQPSGVGDGDWLQ